ncbi:MAG: ParB/RepB/Spo0J family partition protein [Planctomycetota bacterium]|nr:ParB/RepB/Spo0J family partition protein [Planctomycetota bacterium]
MARRKDARRSDRGSSRATREETAGRRRLGRGLESLISSPVRVDVPPAPGKESPAPETAAADRPASPAGSAEPPADLHMIPIAEVRPNPHQPRRAFDEGSLRGLAQSIESAGLMQPIVIRPAAAGGFEIVAGERRWRAAQLLGLEEIPAVVREIDDRAAAEWSLVENLQREDLNPVERSEAFQRLSDEFGLTHQEIADHVGLQRSSVTNHLRLLELDDATQDALRSGRIGMGHGRALLTITNIEERGRLAQRAAARGWSVRELERRLRGRGSDRAASPPATPTPQKAHLEDLQRRLGEHLGTKVRIESGRKKGEGRLIVSFYSLDEFEGLLRRIGFRYE